MTRQIGNKTRLLLLILTIVNLSFLLLITNRVQAGPETTLIDAWQSIENSRYTFSTHVKQTTYPAPRLTAVGSTARIEGLMIDGTSNRKEGTLHLAMWDNPAAIGKPDEAIEVKVEGAKAWGRTHNNSTWQPVEDISTVFAPSGDAAAFLSAAENVVYLGQDTRQVPAIAGEMRNVAFERYHFNLNGDAYAETMRRQLEAELQRTNALPPGISLDASDQFRNMVTSGEAWLDQEGLPLRIMLTMEFPQQANGERVIVEVETTFTGFELEDDSIQVAFFDEPLTFLADNIQAAFNRVDWVSVSVGGATISLAVFGMVVLARPASKRRYRIVAGVICFQLLLGPLTPFLNTGIFDRFWEHFPELAVNTAEAGGQVLNNLEQAGKQVFDIFRSPLETGKEQYTAESQAATASTAVLNSTQPAVQVDGPDADEDGLFDNEEGIWGTLVNTADTDGDGLPDGIEVGYCPNRTNPNAGENSTDPICPDPTVADTDGDGLNDAEELLYLGTSANTADSDIDGLNDGVEVKGFLVAGDRRYSDPLNPDTDQDSLLDGEECPQLLEVEGSAGNLTCEDTDGDGEPDIFDLDNDNDGVPNHLDLAPTQVYGIDNPFTSSPDEAFQLRLESLTVNEPVLVDFQIRPSDERQLSFALNVLDWPSGDAQGQVQRFNDTTFGDVSGAAENIGVLEGQVERDFIGDMRLTPMLEISIPGDTLALPRVNASHTVDLTTRGTLIQSIEMRQGNFSTIDIIPLKPDSQSLIISKGSCQSNTLVETYNISGISRVTGTLGAYADGGHVLELVVPSRNSTYCEEIPRLVDGATSLSVTFQDPGQSLGSLTLAQQGSDTAFNFDLAAGIGPLDIQLADGLCGEGGTATTVATGMSGSSTSLLTARNAVDVADGAHSIVMRQNNAILGCANLGNIVNGSLTTMIDQALLDQYQITVFDEPGGMLTAMSPLQQTVNPDTGAAVAFNGQMFYQQSASATLEHTVNVIWLVTVLTDSCPGGDCSDPLAVSNQTQIVHRYRDEAWYLSGMNVTEDWGTGVALIFEKPPETAEQQANNPAELEDYLWHAADGLQRIFVDGVDVDGDNQRDLTLTDIQNRWGNPERDTDPNDPCGGGTGGDQGAAVWGIPAGALEVCTYQYEHQAEMGRLVGEEIPRLLTETYGNGAFPFPSLTGQPTTTLYPSFLFATEQRSRSVTMELTRNLTFEGSTLTASFPPQGSANEVRPVTTAALSWKPFGNTGGTWEAMPMAEYWEWLAVIMPFAFADSEIDEATAEIQLAQLAYVYLYMGVANAVEWGDSPAQLLWDANENDTQTDEEMERIAEGITSGGEILGDLIASFIEPAIEVLVFEYQLNKRLKQPRNWRLRAQLQDQLSVKQALGRAISHAWEEKGVSFRKLFVSPNGRLPLRQRALRGGSAAGRGVGVAAGLVSLMVDPESNNTAERATAISANGIEGAQAIYEGVEIARKYHTLRAQNPATAFKSLTQSLKVPLTRAAKIAGAVGLVIVIGAEWGAFIYQMVAGGVSAFSLEFNQALANVIGTTIVIVLMAALAATGIGAIAVAIIGAIDIIIAIACGIRPPDEEEVALVWICKGITGIASELIAAIIYDQTDIIDINNPNRLQFTGFKPGVSQPENGFVPGASLTIQLALQNTIQTQTPDGWGVYYFWQYSEENTRQAAFIYDITNEEEENESRQLHNEVALGDQQDDWVQLTGGPLGFLNDGLYRYTEIIESDGAEIALPVEPGLNLPVDAYLAEGYASPTQECILALLAPVCWVRSRSASQYSNLQLRFDVFPATLNEFYELTPKDDGYALAWSQPLEESVLGQTIHQSLSFPRLVDADGDGLNWQVDPLDNRVDADGDGLTDLREAQLGTNALVEDSDSDGLLDSAELRYGTDPLLADSDFDGLSDKDEIEGWEIAYNFVNGSPRTTHVTSDPLSADADEDGLSDVRERALGFSPFVPSDPTVMEYEISLREVGAPILLLRIEEPDGATTFTDVSRPNSGLNAACTAENCPTSAVLGQNGNAAYFDGDDVLSFESAPALNGLTNDFTVAAWVQADAVDGVRRIISSGRNPDNSGWGLGVVDGRLRFTLYSVADFDTTAVYLSQSEGNQNWQHIAVVVQADGNQTHADFYVNNEFVERVTQDLFGGLPATANRFMIGATTEIGQSGLVEQWHGRIDEVVVFDRVLSADERFVVYSGRYNPADGYVTGGQTLAYEANVQNKLLGRTINGLVTTELPPGLNGTFPAENFVLGPTERLDPPLSSNVTVVADALSGEQELTQQVGAVVDIPPEFPAVPVPDFRWEKTQFFDVGNPQFDLPLNTLSLETGDFTVLLWIKPEKDLIDQQYESINGIPAVRGIFGRFSGTSEAFPSLQLFGRKLRFGYGTGENFVVRTTPTDVLPAYDGDESDWTHLAVRYAQSSTNADIYVNGTLAATLNFNGVEPTHSFLSVEFGRSSLDNNDSIPFSGGISTAQFFTGLGGKRGALTTEEINQLRLQWFLAGRFGLNERPGATDFDNQVRNRNGRCDSFSCPVTGLPGREGLAARFTLRQGIEATGVEDPLALEVENFGYAYGAWIKPETVPNGQLQSIILFNTGTAGITRRHGLFIRGLAGGRYEILYREATVSSFELNVFERVSEESYLLNTWHHVMVSFTPYTDGSGYRGRLYIDGALADLQGFSPFDITIAPSNESNVFIGADNVYQALNGFIDDAIFFSSSIGPRTAEAIFQSAPQTAWSLDDGSAFLQIDGIALEQNDTPDDRYYLTLGDNRLLYFEKTINVDWGTNLLGNNRYTYHVSEEEPTLSVWRVGSGQADSADELIGTLQLDRNSPVTIGRIGPVQVDWSFVDMAQADNATGRFPQPADGQFYGSFQFDGQNDYLDAGSTTIHRLNNQGFTVAAWIMPQQVGESSPEFHPILGNRNFSENDELFFGLQNGRPLAVINGVRFLANQEVTPNQWTHLAFRKNSSTVTIFLNGAPVFDTPFQTGNNFVRELALTLGRGWDTGRERAVYFNGRLDNISIYPNALWTSAIAELYNSQVTWIDETRSSTVTIDNTAPTASIVLTQTVIPQTPQMLLLRVNDEHSYVASVGLQYFGASGLESLGTAQPCQDAEGNAAFCHLFSPDQEGEWELAPFAVDAVGNFLEFDPFNRAGVTTNVLVDGSPPTAELQPLPITPFRPVPAGNEPAAWLLPLSGTTADPLSVGGEGSGAASVAVTLFNGNGLPVGDPGRQNATLVDDAWSIDYLIRADNPTGIYTGEILVTDKVGNSQIIPLEPFVLDTTAPETAVTFLDAPLVTVGSGNNSVRVPSLLGSSAVLSGTIMELPTGVVTQPVWSGVRGVEVAFEPGLAYGSPFENRPLPEGTTLYLPFDEGNSSADDPNNTYRDLARGHLATCQDESCPINGIGTRNGQGLYFDGVDDVLTLENIPGVNDLTANFVVGAWIKLDDVESLQRIIANSNTDIADGWGLAVWNNGVVFNNFSAFESIESSLINLKPNLWYHVAAFVDGNDNIHFYVNGVPVESGTMNAPITADNEDVLQIGANSIISPDPTNHFAGVLDEVAVVGQVSDATAVIRTLMGQGPTLHLPFEDAPMDGRKQLADLGGMAATVQGGSRIGSLSSQGQVGAYALSGGDSHAVSVEVEAEPGILPYENRPFTMAFWTRNMDGLALEMRPHPQLVVTLFGAVSQEGETINYRVGTEQFSIDLGPTNGWHHYAMTWDGRTLYTYLDGSLKGESTPAAPSLFASQGYLRVLDFTGEDNALDDLRFYQRQLSELELAALVGTNWNTATMTYFSSDGVSGSWTAEIPKGLEGFYTVRVRGLDAAGNFDEEPSIAWSGLVDTLSPRIIFTSEEIGSRTRYTLQAADFNLDSRSLFFPRICRFSRQTSTTLYQSAWYQALRNQSDVFSRLRVNEMTVTCTLSRPLPDNTIFRICDTARNCAAVQADGTILDEVEETVRYTVQQGDSLYGIATRFGVTWQDLMQLNRLRNPNRIYPGQELLIFGRPDPIVYRVGWGDTLSTIARRFRVPIDEIVALNNISDPALIFAGMTLLIPVR